MTLATLFNNATQILCTPLNRVVTAQTLLTCDTCEELPGKFLDMRARKWHELIRFEEIEHALAVEVGDYADVIFEIEAIPKVYAFVSVVSVVGCQRRQDS